MSLILIPPRNKIQRIVYQTILPYYSSSILEDYEKAVPGAGHRILQMIEKDVAQLEESQIKWNKLNKSFFGPSESFESHLARCGYNVTGRYFGHPNG